MRMKKYNDLVSVLLFASLFTSTLSAFQVRQDSFSYTNNYGASKKDIFPQLDETHDDPDRSVQLSKIDTDLLLGGRVRQEGFLFNRSITLRDDYNDTYGFMRSKVNLDFRAQYGRRAYNKAAAEFYTRVSAFTLWDDESVYTPILSNDVEFTPGNFMKKAKISEHKHEGVVPFIYLDEGWVKVNFDTFAPSLPWETSLQVGNFPFMVGNGISLGCYFEGGVEFLGWERRGDIGNATQRPPGVLLSVLPTQDSGLEFYFSKWRKRSHGPDWTRKEVRAKRLDITDRDDPANLQRGVHADRNLFAARGFYNWKPKGYVDAHIYFEPYAVYVDAPELKVEYEGDASAKIGTLGVMAEFVGGGWTINAEVAGQWGEHVMHPIDRNHKVVDDAYYIGDDTLIAGVTATNRKGHFYDRIGRPMAYESHIFLGFNSAIGSEYLPYRAYYTTQEQQYINHGTNRSLEQQGQEIMLSDGSPYENTDLYDPYVFSGGSKIEYLDKINNSLLQANGRLYNANLPFGGMQRFRKGYTLDLASMMAVFDASYELPSKRGKFSFAAGYVSGDEYPFNEEKDRTYSGFIPLRDNNFVGRNVTSFVVLYPRKLARPVTQADTTLYAHNNYQTMQNLAYLGAGLQFYPFKRKDAVMIELNALSFWEPSPPKRWDVNKIRTFPASKAGYSAFSDGTSHTIKKEDSIYERLLTKELHFSGAHTAEAASHHLGFELNGVLTWRPTYNCSVTARAGFFLPGALYGDIEGMPNKNTIRVDKDGDVRYDSLGTKIATGGMLRITYKF